MRTTQTIQATATTQMVVPTLEATQVLTAATTPAKTATTILGVTQALTHQKTADSFSTEPLPESSRPRKDGPGGD